MGQHGQGWKRMLPIMLMAAAILIAPLGSEAEAGRLLDLIKNRDLFKNHTSNNDLKDLILMLKDQVDMVKDQNEMIKDQLDNLPSGGGGAVNPCDVPPVWGKTYATADRFVPVLGGAAFCDKATGLVWDGSPDPAGQTSWQFAVAHCNLRTVGGQQGFHLPMIEQLTSLLPLLATDLNSATGDGPFSNVQSTNYWSATTVAILPSSAWIVGFNVGSVSAGDKTNANTPAWCVRGGQVFDGNTHSTEH